MLTDPNYFRISNQYPPQEGVERINKFQGYRDLYDGSSKAWRLLYPNTIANVRRERGFASADEVTRAIPEIRNNMFRKLSRFWGSLLYSFPPIVDSDLQDYDRIGTITRSIYDAGLKVAIDSSRFGTGVFFIANTGSQDIIRAIDPAHWFPVVDRRDNGVVLGDIIAVPYNSDPNKVDELVPDRLRVTRLLIGEPATIQTFQLTGSAGEIGNQIGATEEGGVVTRRAIASVINGYENDYYGESDYPDLIPLVAEIDARLSGNSNVLDRHTNPHMYGPKSAISYDPNGNAVINVGGQYFPIDEDDKPPAYITWDANLEANFTQIQHCFNLFHMLSDTSAAAFGIQGDGNSVESGAALRKLLYTSFLRLGILRREHEKAIRAIFRILSPQANPSITWNEPFLDGLIDGVNAEATRIQSGTTSPLQAIQRLDHVTAREAQTLLEQINEQRERQPQPQPEPEPERSA